MACGGRAGGSMKRLLRGVIATARVAGCALAYGETLNRGDGAWIPTSKETGGPDVVSRNERGYLR